MRIVSLVPSLTELVIDLGLGNELVGRTKFCIHPKDQVNTVPKIGGTKKINIQAVIELRPDLILANKEENTREDVEALQKHTSVLVTDISNFEEALQAIQKIGQLTNRIEESQKLIDKINSNFSKIKGSSNKPRSVCYLIWKDPLMTIGHDTYIHSMLNKCGYDNVFSYQDRYPVISIDEIRDKNPEFIFLSSEPFPFKDKHIKEIEEMYPGSKTILVDGEYFSWYGSRMILAGEYFVELKKKL